MEGIAVSQDLVQRYWVHTPELFDERMDEILRLHGRVIDGFELCKNNAGEVVRGFRMGRGKRHVFLLGREHGHEPVGTCGLTALMEGLATGTVPGSGRPYPDAANLLDRLTLHLFPLTNVDGARRFAAQVPDSFPGTFFKYCKEDSDRYRAIHSEPGDFLKHERPPHFSDEEMARWRKTGRPIGSLFTEDGVEMWLDWKYEKSPQVRALKRAMHESPPVLFVDVHAWEGITSLLAARADEKEMDREKQLGSVLCEALAKASLPVDKAVTEVGGEGHTSPEWVNSTFGAAAYLFEVHNGYLWFNPDLKPEGVRLPVVTKEQIILTVWHGITALLGAVAGAE